MKYFMPAFFCLFFSKHTSAQEKNDSTVTVGKKTITLSEVVVNNKLNVPAFINRIKNDTSFYKAFRNLHILSFTAINDIRMNEADGKTNPHQQLPQHANTGRAGYRRYLRRQQSV
jgi:hypothetical protein